MKIIKRDGKNYIELPGEFSGVDDAELFRLKDGYYLLSIPLGKPVSKPAEEYRTGEGFQIPNEAEKNVLKRLLSIKFHERTPENVNRIFSNEEKKVIAELERKNFINVFKGTKYPNGVYNINDKIYATLYGKKTVKQTVKDIAKPAVASSKKEPVESPADVLDKKGYAVGSSKDLKEIIDKNKTAIKSGKIKGLKGFDGRFYIARMDYVSRMSPLIMRQLDREREIDEIARNLNVEPDAVRTVLHLLAEAGDVIEKRRGVYAAI